MDASQYKDYVLVLLFIKYISDKYAGVPARRLDHAKRAIEPSFCCLENHGA
jgi:type I restriction enzyme M protein